ncbi:MAG: type II toxin-antitoxin system RelB/DinJ family antitoxin [Propionibacteriaceae bacterium]|jgi:addiction module RelB/DinJ family antitoxin|nr:type II toxin-antitoxin system RelB/DinJ family antitoxin [Propionibacteriaceae bacterium]
MSTMVNARVSSADKRVADEVLAASGHTWSQAIQALVSYMAHTRRFPDILAQPSAEELAARRSKVEAWEAMLKTVGPIGPLSDEDVDRIIHEETMRRYG